MVLVNEFLPLVGDIEKKEGLLRGGKGEKMCMRQHIEQKLMLGCTEDRNEMGRSAHLALYIYKGKVPSFVRLSI